MDELIIALLVGLWKLIVKGYEKIRDWNQRREDRLDEGALRRPEADQPARSAPATDPIPARRRALTEHLVTFENEANARSQTLRRSRTTLPLGRAVDELVVPQVVQLRAAAERVPVDAGAMVTFERIAGQTASLERFFETIVWVAGQREDRSYGRPLAEADVLTAACYKPLLTWARFHANVGNRQPVCFIGERSQLDLSAFPEAGLSPIVLPDSFPDRLHSWALVAHEAGRDFLESVPGLKWELRNRFGLPDRYPVPFAYRGYLSEDEVMLPFGPWLEVLFGDLVGTLLLGHAYPAALMEMLASRGRPATVLTVGISPDAAFYSTLPPAHLRMAVAVAVLDDVGQGEQQRRLWESWQRRHSFPQVLYVPTRIEGWIDVPMAPFVDMASRIADLMMLEPMGALAEQSLDTIPDLAFQDLQQSTVDAARAAAVEGRPVTGIDPRAALAGALLASRQSSARSGELMRWLRRSLQPAREAPRPKAVAAPRPGVAAGADDGSLATVLRDAILLGAALERRRLDPSGHLTIR